jgi:hypothetical protein
MSFTFKSIRGSLKMGKTPTVTQIDNVTTSGVNFEYINTSEIVLKNVGAGIVHTDSRGLFSTSALVTTDIAPGAITSDKIADSIALTGKPTAPTASNSTNDDQIATTSYVKNIISDLMGGAAGSLDTLQELAAALQNNADFGNTIVASIATKVSLATDEIISGVKTFASTATPILKSLTTDGVVHNDSNGNLTTSLVTLSDIDIVSGLRSKVQYLIDMYNNRQTTSEPAGFIHVNSYTSNENGRFFYDSFSNQVYNIGIGVRYVIEIPVNIYLPEITREGMTYSITNKSGETIIISTNTPSVQMFSYFVAPDGDDAFEVENHRTLEVYSMIVNGVPSWQARFD